MLLNKAYYTFKFLIPRRLQIQLRRYYVYRKRAMHADIWPIDPNAGKPSEGWAGWPEGKKFALVLTHDVESAKGLERCHKLAEIEERLGFRSSFGFVPGDYAVPAALRQSLTERGFEITIHGLHHHENPFRSRSIFRKQALEINRCLKEWGSVGFRCPSMYHNLEMLHELDIEYDASTFDTDPFEPQPDGMGTIFPFWVPNQNPQKGYVELPYTLPQDFLLFILMRNRNNDIWKRKLDWIVDQGGMALFNVHPNYMNFNGNMDYEEYPAQHYEDFLQYIKSRYHGQYWHALPREVARFWADHYRVQSALPSGARLLGHAPCTFIDPVLDPRWDRFVESHPLGLICHLSAWKKVLEESFPQMKGHYLAILNPDSDSIRAALPIFEVKSRLIGSRLVSIPFATNCDPLTSLCGDLRDLLDSAIALSRKLRIPRIELRALESCPLMQQDERIGKVVHSKGHQLSLEDGPEAIIKKVKRQLRQHIHKSLQSGLLLQSAKSETELLEFYRLYVKTRKGLGLPPQPYLFFQSLWKNFFFRKNIALLLVRHEERLVTGLMMFKFKSRCSCEYLAVEEEAENLKAGHFVFWEAIKSAYAEGYKVFDFGRTGINNEGLMTYKNHWGTTVVDLPKFFYPKQICSGLKPPETGLSYKLVRKVSKNIPNYMFQSLGNIVYRHLG